MPSSLITLFLSIPHPSGSQLSPACDGPPAPKLVHPPGSQQQEHETPIPPIPGPVHEIVQSGTTGGRGFGVGVGFGVVTVGPGPGFGVGDTPPSVAPPRILGIEIRVRGRDGRANERVIAGREPGLVGPEVEAGGGDGGGVGGVGDGAAGGCGAGGAAGGGVGAALHAAGGGCLGGGTLRGVFIVVVVGIFRRVGVDWVGEVGAAAGTAADEAGFVAEEETGATAAGGAGGSWWAGFEA